MLKKIIKGILYKTLFVVSSVNVLAGDITSGAIDCSTDDQVLASIFAPIYKVIFLIRYLTFVVSLVMLAYCGYCFIWDQEEGRERAKTILKWTIVGVIVLVAGPSLIVYLACR